MIQSEPVHYAQPLRKQIAQLFCSYDVIQPVPGFMKSHFKVTNEA